MIFLMSESVHFQFNQAKIIKSIDCIKFIDYFKGSQLTVAIQSDFFPIEILINIVLHYKIINMASLLIKQFQPMTKAEYFYLFKTAFGSKSEEILNSVFPNLIQNLSSSAEEYINAILNLDSKFIQQTSTPNLQKIILPQIKALKSKHVTIKSYNEKRNLSNIESRLYKFISKQQTRKILISPYVIFGQNMAERLQNPHQFRLVPLFLSWNRFIQNSSLFNLNKIRNEQIYGFNVCLLNMDKAIEVKQGGTIEKYPPREFFLSFETDSLILIIWQQYRNVSFEEGLILFEHLSVKQT